MANYNPNEDNNNEGSIDFHLHRALDNLLSTLGKLVYGKVIVDDGIVFISRDDLPYIPIGEFNQSFVDAIEANNIKAADLKSRIENIKSLINYQEAEISDECRICSIYAKSHLVDIIYCQALLEGVNAKFLDTKSIVENGVISNMKYDDALLLVNLKRAWEFLLDRGTLSWPTTFNLLLEINKKVGEKVFYDCGKIRNVNVKIVGSSYVPPIPVEVSARAEFNSILYSDLPFLDKAIEMLLFVMKKQLFVDGNKRSAVLIANHFLISNGYGILFIPEEKSDEFKKLLCSYYEEESDEIKAFLRNKCFVSHDTMTDFTIKKVI